MTAARLLALLFGVLSHVWLSGCSTDPAKGYSSTPLFRGDISTVAVPILENKTVVRDVEFQLTDALIKEIESRTPYKVTPGGDADTIVLGQIRDVQLDQLSKSRLTGLSEEVILSVTIDFVWKDNRNGKTIVERRSYAGHGLFVPSNPSSEPIELGRFAAVEHLARDIVNEMRSEW